MPEMVACLFFVIFWQFWAIKPMDLKNMLIANLGSPEMTVKPRRKGPWIPRPKMANINDHSEQLQLEMSA